LLVRNSRREAAGKVIKGNQAMALTFMAFPPCRAAAAVPMAISAVPATTASGGVVLARTVAASPTTGVWATTTRAPSTTTTIRATCSVFVACRTKRVAPPLAVRQAVQPYAVSVHFGYAQ